MATLDSCFTAHPKLAVPMTMAALPTAAQRAIATPAHHVRSYASGATLRLPRRNRLGRERIRRRSTLCWAHKERRAHQGPPLNVTKSPANDQGRKMVTVAVLKISQCAGLAASPNAFSTDSLSL